MENEQAKTIIQQQRAILEELRAMRQPDQGANDITILRADVTAVERKIERQLEEEKKSGQTSARLSPGLQLELIGWRREDGGIHRFYREIGR